MTYKKIKKFQSKRHFQLLEILVAMVLIVSCAFPAMHIFTDMYKHQVAIVQNYELDHLIHRLYASIIERMYTNQIPLEGSSEELKHEDTEFATAFQNLGYKCTYTLKQINTKKQKNKDKTPESLYSLIIKLQDPKNDARKREYNYSIYVLGGNLVEKEGEEEENEGEEEQSEEAKKTPIQIDKNKEKKGNKK